MINADITISEVETPIGKICSSGHIASDLFRRSGPDSPEEQTRFFHVSSKDINITVCEPCLIIVNYMANQIKNK